MADQEEGVPAPILPPTQLQPQYQAGQQQQQVVHFKLVKF